MKLTGSDPEISSVHRPGRAEMFPLTVPGECVPNRAVRADRRPVIDLRAPQDRVFRRSGADPHFRLRTPDVVHEPSREPIKLRHYSQLNALR